jgi:hypothetical protein
MKLINNQCQQLKHHQHNQHNQHNHHDHHNQHDHHNHHLLTRFIDAHFCGENKGIDLLPTVKTHKVAKMLILCASFFAMHADYL